MPKLVIKDMKYGQQADGGVREDALSSFRRLVNYDIIFGGETPRLRVRPGYNRYNAVPLAGIAEQVHSFVDMEQNSHIIARVDNDRWYAVREAGAHFALSTFDATGRQPVTQFGDRLFLGTDGTDPDDSGMIWTDDTQISGSPASFRLGIKRPAGVLGVETVLKEGNTRVSTDFMGMYADRTKFAIKYLNATLNQSIRTIAIKVMLQGGFVQLPGSWQVRIYADNAGEPSDTRFHDDAISGWSEVMYFDHVIAMANATYREFVFPVTIDIPAGTTVWFVIEGDDTYFDNVIYHDPVAPADFFGALVFAAGAAEYGDTLFYHPGTDTWNAAVGGNFEAVFYLGGIDHTKWYDYVYTYLNADYSIESRPSEAVRITPTATHGIKISGIVASSDPQADSVVRIYRREVEEEATPEADITDVYHFVAEIPTGYLHFDYKDTDALGALLQTENHYCLDDFAGQGEEGRKAAIVPSCACFWKGRIVVGISGSNELSFSKVFEQDGATGLIGTSSPDFFPLTNTIEIPEPAEPVDLYPLSNDQLLVYMSNETIYSIYGFDQPLNPPADVARSAISQTHGLVGMHAFTPLISKHWIMTRDGLISIEGIGALKVSKESETNNSILAAIENQYLANTRMLAVGNEIWMLIDTNNDGDHDTILILSLEREILDRGLYDRHWKMYQYDVDLRDFCMKNTGDEFRQVYAADADNNYILELNIGTDDNGSQITAWLESHDLTAQNIVMIDGLEIDAYYPDESAIPDYTWTLEDHPGNTESGVMDGITGNEDVRGHKTGTRLARPISVRAKISQDATKANEIRAILIHYNGF
jgi:hypothetical protein